jgi:hypothetical protein
MREHEFFWYVRVNVEYGPGQYCKKRALAVQDLAILPFASFLEKNG